MRIDAIRAFTAVLPQSAGARRSERLVFRLSGLQVVKYALGAGCCGGRGAVYSHAASQADLELAGILLPPLLLRIGITAVGRHAWLFKGVSPSLLCSAASHFPGI